MDVHFNGYKIRYTILDAHFKSLFESTNISSINIFVNLDDFFHILHRPLIDNEFQVYGANAAKQFASNILNLLAHYKHWAIKYHNLDVKVYGVYTYYIRTFKNALYIPNYREKYKQRFNPENEYCYYVNAAIRDSVQIFTTIGQYIPDIYLIDSKYLEPSCIPFYIGENVQKADWNMLITRDTYDLQYAYRDRWTVLRPKGDNSSILNRATMWNYVNEKEHVFRDKDKDIQYEPSLYVYAKSIVGDTYRNIPRLRRVGWKTLFSILDQVTENHSTESSPFILRKELIEFLKGKHMTDEEFDANLHAIDVEMQSNLIMSVDATAIQSQLIDRMDYDALTKLNREVFFRFPLRLDFLCERKIKKNLF